MRRLTLLTATMLGISMLCLFAGACEVPPEGAGGNWAVVRYEIEIAPGGFTSDVIEGFPLPLCNTARPNWIANKRLDAQDVPVDIPRVSQLKRGEVHADGNCLMATTAFEAVPPGEYRVVTTDYEWTADCSVTLIAQQTSGQAHRLRFIQGQPGCTADVITLPAPE